MISSPQVVDLVLAEAARRGRADETIVLVTDRSTASLRWARNTMTTNGESVSRETTVISIVRQGDKARVGAVKSSEVDPSTIAGLVAASQDAAEAAPEARDSAPPLAGVETSDDWEAPSPLTGAAVFGNIAARLVDGFHRSDALYGFARHELDQLGETALLIDDWLDRHEAAKSLSVTSKDLALRVFEAQIMLEQAASFLWWLDQDEPWPEGLVDAFAALRICLDNNPTEEQLRQARRMGAAAADKADLSTSAGVATVTAYRALQAHLAIHHITTNARGISDDDIAAAAAETDGDDGQDAPSGLDPSTKAAIQVAVATSAATVLGNLISPDRGYWAVLTAFLVFTGVSTRGEILSRAGHRIVGTIAGVVAGVLLAAEIGRNPALQIVVLVVCVFFAFYLATVAYFWLTFFVTVLLAMLYGLLGNFSAQVLEVRIAETGAGSLVGIASAYFVFSTKTRATFAEKVNDYLDHMERVIDTAVTAVLTAGDAGDLVADTRRMDNALKEAVTAGKPLQMGPLSELRHGVRRLMRGLQVANRSAHALARAGVTASHVGPPPEGADDALHQAAACAGDAIARVRKLVAGDDVRNEKRSEAAVFDVGLPEMRPGPVRASVRALNVIDRALTEVTVRV